MDGLQPTRESFTARLYHRIGAWYLLVMAGVVALVALVDIGVAVIGALEYGLARGGVMSNIALVAGAGCLVATVLSMYTARRLMRPLWDWVAGRRDAETAVEVWSASTEKLPTVTLLGGAFFVGGCLPAAVYAAAASGFRWYGTLVAVAWMVILVAAATIVDYLALEAMLRPVLRDVAARLPSDFAFPAFGARLRPKLLAAVAVLVSFSSALAVGAGGLVETPTAQLGVAIGVATAMTLTLALLLSSMLARSVASPVEQLVRAAGDVERGNLEVRVPVMGWDEMGTLAKSFNSMVRGLREREALRSAMGAYVHPDIARRVLEEGQLLDGVEAHATVVFLDVRGFTALAETMEATESVAFLNQLFSAIVPVIDEHGGHVNKFLGDGLLAVFGVPEVLPDHASRAVRAASAIASQVARDYRGAVRIGIGINSGPVVAGTIGGGAHLEFALIGDTVNVAARIEQLTKDGEDAVLITDATRRLCAELPAEPRGSVVVRGRREAIAVFAVPLRSAALPAQEIAETRYE